MSVFCHHRMVSYDCSTAAVAVVVVDDAVAVVAAAVAVVDDADVCNKLYSLPQLL